VSTEADQEIRAPVGRISVDQCIRRKSISDIPIS